MDIEQTNESKPAEAKAAIDPKAARRELFRALFLCLIAVIIVRSFLFEFFKIPSSSMVPTLRIGDHIVVSKYNYGWVFPFTSWEFVSWGTPKRGDVIVFIYPKDESLHYIKRVIGLPGDKVEFKGKDLWLNGEKVQRELVKDPGETALVTGSGGHQLGKGPGVLFKETIDGRTHYVKYASDEPYDFVQNPEAHTVAPDSFFVMGDNRDDSYDSRSWGDVPRHNLRGKAQFIWISLNRESTWSASDFARWDRSMKAIH